VAAPHLVASKQGAILWVRVQPRARRAGVEGYHGDRLKIALTAPPVEGAANEALVRFLAELVGVARGDVEVVAGQTAREKSVAFRNLSVEELSRRLVPHLPDLPAGSP
jgi:uncharacterized protein (TIGR00251 family)